MPVSYKIQIPQVDVRPSDDTIRVVHWRVTASDDAVIDPETGAPFVATVYGAESVPEGTSVAYGTVTKAQVVNWLKNRPTSNVGETLAQAVRANLDSQIEAFATPALTQESKPELMAITDF